MVIAVGQSLLCRAEVVFFFLPLPPPLKAEAAAAAAYLLPAVLLPPPSSHTLPYERKSKAGCAGAVAPFGPCLSAAKGRLLPPFHS